MTNRYESRFMGGAGTDFVYDTQRAAVIPYAVEQIMQPHDIADALNAKDATIAALQARVDALEDENKWMYGALWEASQAGVSAATRCKLEIERIARKDAGITPEPPAPDSAFVQAHAAVIADSPTPEQWEAFEALKTRDLSSRATSGTDERAGRK